MRSGVARTRISIFPLVRVCPQSGTYLYFIFVNFCEENFQKHILKQFIMRQNPRTGQIPLFRVVSEFGSVRALTCRGEAGAPAARRASSCFCALVLLRCSAGQSPSHDGATRLCCELVILRVSNNINLKDCCKVKS